MPHPLDGSRGRRRTVDAAVAAPDEAGAIAQQLCLARGYDAVGVADVTEALGINPPSFTLRSAPCALGG